MKSAIYDINGSKKSEIELPSVFNSPIREDLALKYFLVKRFEEMHPYSHDPEAGRKHSASGRIRHSRRLWRTHYGKGISRIPRKTMWRRGTQFYWIGAEVSGTRGGRRVHGPTLNKASKKINKREILIALKSGFAATALKNLVLKRYSTLSGSQTSLLFPIVIESKIEKIKTKDFIDLLKKIFGNISLVLKNKEVRSGRGKLRGRKYKSNAGLLLIKSKDENIKMSGITAKSVHNVNISDLYPLGRLALYTEKALIELDNLGGKNVA